jgi:hypothetical protein
VSGMQPRDNLRGDSAEAAVRLNSGLFGPERPELAMDGAVNFRVARSADNTGTANLP